MDLLKKKHLLLDLVVQLTEGVVSGKKVAVKPLFKPHSHSTKSTPLQGAQAPLPENAAKESSCPQKAGQAQLGYDSDADSAVRSSGLLHTLEGTGEVPMPSPPVPGDSKKKGWPHFREVFMLAALHADGVETLKVRCPEHLDFASVIIFSSEPLSTLAAPLVNSVTPSRLSHRGIGVLASACLSHAQEPAGP